MQNIIEVYLFTLPTASLFIYFTYWVTSVPTTDVHCNVYILQLIGMLNCYWLGNLVTEPVIGYQIML